MGKGINIGHLEKLSNIRYADDIIIYAESPEELVAMMEEFELVLQRGRLRTKCKKVQNSYARKSSRYIKSYGKWQGDKSIS